jgi:hypothetical protein
MLFLVAAWGRAASAESQPAAERDPAELRAAEPDTEQRARNAIFLEGFGAAFFYSINYERMVVEDLGVRVGVGILPVEANSPAPGSGQSAGWHSTSWFVFLPVTVDYVGIRTGSHALELGAGLTGVYRSGYAGASGSSFAPGSSSSPLTLVTGVAMIGYRFQSQPRPTLPGFVFRVGAEAVFAQREVLGPPAPVAGDLGVLPWPYVSVGFAL